MEIMLLSEYTSFTHALSILNSQETNFFIRLTPTIKIAARDTAASRVLPTQSRSCRMGEKWPDA